MPELFTPFMLLAGGLVLLVAGGESLVRGASQLATAARISPLVVGLTIVAFGTSAPELAVSVKSSLSGQAAIAVGNVVGSNIFNVLFILGISALVAPLIVSSRLIRQEVPLMIAVSVLVLLLAIDLNIGRIEGSLLFLGVVAYTIWAIYTCRTEPQAADSPPAVAAVEGRSKGLHIALQLGLIAVGLLLLVLGARWLVDGAVAIARFLEMSELVIGLTIVAAGTSLPEVAASLMASLRGERDIAVGNVVGSNLFNILCVLGLSAVVSPDGVAVSPEAFRQDIPVMIAVAIACLPIFITGHVIARWEGGLFLAYYVAYVAYLVFAATSPAFGRSLGTAMVAFVLPLTALTLIVTVVRWSRAQRDPSAHS